MLDLHVWVGIAVVATNLVAGAWGGAAWLASRPSVGFWLALRLGQATVVLQAMIGFLLLAEGRQPADGLHLVYGLLPVLVALMAEGVRAGAAQRELGDIDFHSLGEADQRTLALAIVRRETGIMAASALVVFGLSLRAATMQGGL